MKISTNREDLLRPLSQVGGVVERRQTLPILANVLIRVQDGELEVTATDLEVELRSRTVVTGSEDGEFTIPARKLIDICKALPEDTGIDMDVSGDKAVIRAGRGRYTVSTLSANDFPAIEPASATAVFQLGEAVLKRLIEKTQFAMAQQDVRYYLNGMLLEVRPGRIRTVATDGHRLALCDAPFEPKSELDLQVILPRKAVQELNRMLTADEGDVTMELSGSHIKVTKPGVAFVSKLIDGRFPDYERVMPRESGSQMSADREMLRAALSRTAILSNEKYRGIRFGLVKDAVQLQAHNPEQDEAEEEVAVSYEGPEMNIGFNVGYLLDVLGVIDSEEIRMLVVDGNSSSVITPAEQDAGNESRYVVMPMRL